MSITRNSKEIKWKERNIDLVWKHAFLARSSRLSVFLHAAE